MPNYQAYLNRVPYGKERITNPDGSIYFSASGTYPRVKDGLFIGNPSVVRYDTFQKLGIKVPTTTDELLDAGRKLKAAYPNTYPISWYAGHSFAFAFKTSTEIYWNGSAYSYGPIENNFRTYLTFLNKLYSEGLLDPETFTQNDETRTRKALNGSSFYMLGFWEDQLVNWNNKTDAVWAFSKSVSDPTIGTGWQGVFFDYEYSIGISEATYVKAGAKNMDTLIKLCDASFDPETVRLVTWGVEGTSYTLKSDGNPTYVQKYHDAPNGNYWLVGDDYGTRISSKYRPGIQGVWDLGAAIDALPPQPVVIDNKYVETVWPLAFPEVHYPNDPQFPPWGKAYPITFSADESNANASLMNAITTYYNEQYVKFITGEAKLDNATWNDYVSRIRGMNLQRVLDSYNSKAAAFK
jgi:putative aldouronate transport system substrate-binding protein